MNVPSDLLTEIVRENDLERYFSAVCDVPASIIVRAIDSRRRAVSPERVTPAKASGVLLHPYRSYPDIFADLDEVFGLCDFDELVRIAQAGVDLDFSERFLFRLPGDSAEIPRDRIKSYVLQMYGPGILPGSG